MKRFNVTIAANVRAYATIEIEAKSRKAAEKRLAEIIKSLADHKDTPETSEVTFNAEYDTLSDYEALEDDLQLITP